MVEVATATPGVANGAVGYRRRLLVNSLVAYALALLVSVTLHELGHAVAALGLGATPTVFPFSVDTGVDTDTHRLVTALAGPVVSLVLGLLALALPSPSNGFARLAQLWFGLVSVQATVGYLMIAVIPNVGDISSAIRYAQAPSWVGYPVFAVGLAGMLLVGRVATVRLAHFADPAADLAPQLRRAGLLAWLAGTGLTLVVSIGAFDSSAVGFLEMFGVLTAGIFLTLVRLYMRRTPTLTATGPLPLRWPIVGAVLLALVAILRLAVLAPGLPL